MTTNQPKHVIVNGSVSKQVTKILTDQIIAGKYLVGDYLPTEEVLCSEFGIGRSSVREAIKTLESRGMVRKLQGKGIIVIDKTIEATAELIKITLEYRKISLKDMIDFRESMEVTLAELAAVKCSNEDISEMYECIEKMSSVVDSYEEFADYDYQFHECIAKASGNTIATLMVKALRPLLHKQISHNIKQYFSPKQALSYHYKIFDEVKNHRAKAAGQAMAEHLKETHRVVREESAL